MLQLKQLLCKVRSLDSDFYICQNSIYGAQAVCHRNKYEVLIAGSKLLVCECMESFIFVYVCIFYI